MNSGPTFIGIGAPRCGTTWLHNQLKMHPNVWMPPLKELHYFDRSKFYPSPNTFSISTPLERITNLESLTKTELVKLRRAVGALTRGDTESALWWARILVSNYDGNFYSKLFSSKKFAAKGEITPAYSILDKKDIEKIYLSYPDSKILFMIRNPIDRIWSSIRYNVGRKKLNLDIESPERVIEFLKIQEKDSSDLIKRGEYVKTIENYSKIFPKENILIGFYDAISEKPIELLNNIGDFLGLPSDSFNYRYSLVNKSSIEYGLHEKVEEYLQKRESKLIRILANQIGSYSKRWLDKEFSGNMQPTIRISKSNF